jgi:hypothetical protein
MKRLLISIFFLTLLPPLAVAKKVAIEENYLKTTDYIVAALGAKPDKPGIIWVTRDLKPQIKKILRKKVFPLRYRYYRQGNRTVWILNVVGRTMPITTGITIEGGRIIDLTVLTFRESRGSEVRFPAFKNQFNDIALTEKLRLSKPINGISGATMSSNAMKKASRLALYLNSKLMEKDDPSKEK